MKIIKNFIFIILCSTSISFSSKPDSYTRYFTIIQITPHTYAAIPRGHLLFNATSLIITNDDFLVIVDAHSSPIVAANLVKQIRAEVSTLPVKYVIITHGHDDHILGIQGYRDMLGKEVTIVAHHGVLEHVKAIRAKKEFLGVDFVKSKLKYFEEHKGGTEAQAIADSVSFWLNNVKQTAANFSSPDMLIDRNMEIGTGTERIIIYALHGHSRGDLVVYFPLEKVIATGDLVHDYNPLFFSGFSIYDWIKTLKFLNTLDIEYHVGGHGDFFEGKNRIVLWENYLKTLVALVAKAKKNQVPLEKLLDDIVSGKTKVDYFDQMGSVFKHISVNENIHSLYLQGGDAPFKDVIDQITMLYSYL